MAGTSRQAGTGLRQPTSRVLLTALQAAHLAHNLWHAQRLVHVVVRHTGTASVVAGPAWTVSQGEPTSCNALQIPHRHCISGSHHGHAQNSRPAHPISWRLVPFLSTSTARKAKMGVTTCGSRGMGAALPAQAGKQGARAKHTPAPRQARPAHHSNLPLTQKSVGTPQGRTLSRKAPLSP